MEGSDDIPAPARARARLTNRARARGRVLTRASNDEFSFLDIEINPAVRLPKGSPAGLIMEGGTITVGTGGNVWAGGENKASYGVGGYLRGATLRVDGKVLVRDGSLQTPR